MNTPWQELKRREVASHCCRRKGTRDGLGCPQPFFSRIHADIIALSLRVKILPAPPIRWLYTGVNIRRLGP